MKFKEEHTTGILLVKSRTTRRKSTFFFRMLQVDYPKKIDLYGLIPRDQVGFLINSSSRI